jgi:oxalate decarboxylase/phosphoglucose isomerase-like protein (cupin superfamily)
MDEQRCATVREMGAGATHYIPRRIAHLVVNTGAVPLTFLACWPSDAGYDYAVIRACLYAVPQTCGFSAVGPQPERFAELWSQIEP